MSKEKVITTFGNHRNKEEFLIFSFTKTKLSVLLLFSFKIISVLS
jgi:hypothetical protein